MSPIWGFWVRQPERARGFKCNKPEANLLMEVYGLAREKKKARANERETNKNFLLKLWSFGHTRQN